MFISLDLVFWVLYTVWIWILPDAELTKIFLPFCGLPFCATLSFAVPMVCNSTKPCLSIVDLMPWAARFLFQKSEAVPVSRHVLLTLSFTVVQHSGFYIQSFGPTGTDLQGERWGSSWILLHATHHLSQHPLLKRLSFLLCLLFAIFAKNQVTIIVWTYIWVLCSMTLIYMSVYDSTLPFLLPRLRSIS